VKKRGFWIKFVIKKDMAQKAEVFPTEKLAKEFADKMNKTSKVYKYILAVYPKEYGGNGKKLIVRKVKK
jgi:hypothetical protein